MVANRPSRQCDTRYLGGGRNSGWFFALCLLIIAINSSHAISAEMASAGRQTQPDSCIVAANPTWSEPEHRAWRSLCDKDTVDLSQVPNQRLDPGSKGCLATFATAGEKYPDPVIYGHDPGRLLSSTFFDDIFHNAKYFHFVENTPIRIRGAFIPALYISNVAVSALRIDNSLIGDVEVRNTKFDSSLSFCDFTTIKNRIVASNLNAPEAEFYRVSVLSNCFYGVDPCLTIENSSLPNVSIVLVNTDKINITSTHVDNTLFMNEDNTKAISIQDSSAGEIYMPKNTISILSFYTLDVKRGISVGNVQWKRLPPRPGAPARSDLGSLLQVSRVATPRFNYSLTGSEVTLPDKIQFQENVIGTIFLGGDPLRWLQRIQGPPETVLDVYDTTAKTYAMRSRSATARELSYQREILADAAEYNVSNYWGDAPRHISRMVSRLVVGYGYYPEWGVLAIFGFVLIAWPIFATGATKITSDTRPHSWFIFSLDTVIPILSLDSRDNNITFKGFRQYFLYFMRLLGAGLVFLVIAYLKQAIFGPG